MEPHPAGHPAHLAGQVASHPATAWVVLAAGMGTRMRSALPKVLHPLCGRPLGAFALATAATRPDWQLVVVVGHDADRVEAQLRQWADRLGAVVCFARQKPQLGTGHAVGSALPALAPSVKEVLVSYADVPLLRAQTLQALLEARRRAGASVAVLTAHLDDPTGYGRVLRRSGVGGCQAGANGGPAPAALGRWAGAAGEAAAPGGQEIVGIVEERDATPQQRAIREVNAGIYCFERGPLEEALAQLRPDNAQGEYYLTDAVGWLAASGRRVVGVSVEDPVEILGVNDRSQLLALEGLLRERTRRELLASGVSFLGHPPAEVDPWVVAEPDCTLYSGAFVGGESRLGRGCVVGPGARIVDSVLEEGVLVEGVTLVSCHVGRGARLGGGVAIPAGCRIAPGAVIGKPALAPGFLQGGQAT